MSTESKANEMETWSRDRAMKQSHIPSKYKNLQMSEKPIGINQRR